MNELLITLMTYFAVPITAWRLYTRLYDRMESRGVADPPSIQYFLIFTVYAGWLMVFFILLSGAWADFMFLVLVYLLLVAPVLMLGVAMSVMPVCPQSSYHMVAFIASGLYFLMFMMIIFMGIAAVIINPIS